MKTVILPIQDIDFNDTDNMLLSRVSKSRQERINRIRVSHAKKISLYAALLSRMEISSFMGIPNDKIAIQIGKYGKPYIDGYPTVFFNLSHTKNVILFSITDNHEVGVDIEGVSNYSEALCKKVLHKEELDFLYSLPTEKQQDFFFEIWTKKEAYAKYLGTGLRFDLSNLNTFEAEYRDLLYCSKYDKYIFSICCKKIIPTYIEMNENDLINYYLNN